VAACTAMGCACTSCRSGGCIGYGKMPVRFFFCLHGMGTVLMNTYA